MADNPAKNEFCQGLPSYLSIFGKKKQAKNILSFADKTGFSVPSVLTVMHEKKDNIYIKDLASWEPDVLFNVHNNASLTEKIKVIAALKETKLGTEADHAFNEELIANILIHWVKGDKLSDIVKNAPLFCEQRWKRGEQTTE